MKKLKTRNEYFASNVRFYADELTAYSYNHWCFLRKINDKIIFNNYNYSPTTNRHQSKVLSLLYKLNIKVDQFVYLQSTLTDENFKNYGLYYFYKSALDIIVQNNSKRIRQKTKIDNLVRLLQLKNKIINLKKLGAEFNFHELYRLYRDRKKSRDNKESFLKEARQAKKQIFRKDNIRVAIKSYDINRKTVYIKELNTQKTFTMYWKNFKDQYEICPLSTILN